MKLTQEKLAELAAAVAASGRYKPRQAVQAAFEVWEAAGARLAASEAQGAKLEAADAELAAFAAKLPEGSEPIPLEVFQKLFVDDKPERAAKRWRDHSSDCIAEQEGLKGKKLEAALERAMERERLEGIPRDFAPMLARQFTTWRARDKAEQASAKGSKAAAARKRGKGGE